MGEIIITIFVIGLVAVVLICIIMHFALKQLEKTLAGRIIIGVIVLVAGIFSLVIHQPVAGIVAIVLAIIYLLIVILTREKL